MSKLSQSSRKFETFDPDNKEHRRIFHEAMKHNTWSKSPIRFWIDGEQIDLIAHCTAKLSQWYAEREFGKK